MSESIFTAELPEYTSTALEEVAKVRAHYYDSLTQRCGELTCKREGARGPWTSLCIGKDSRHRLEEGADSGIGVYAER